MALRFEISGAQIDGARDYQEDAFLITNLTDAEGQPSALVVVADGMGGHAAGNVASNMAVQAFNKYVSSNYPSDDIASVLHGAVLKANGSIAETIRETSALSGMGCTMVAILTERDKLWWASVGDSHIYLLRDKELTKKNADHSYGGFLDRMAAAGKTIEPEPGLSRNMLMSAVTGEDITEIDCPEEPFILKGGDRLLLCSDGLDTLSDGKIIQYCDWSEKPRECAEALLKAVEEEAMPRQDNTTVIVIDVIDTAADAKQAAASEAELKAGDTQPIEIVGDLASDDEILDSDTPVPGIKEPEPAPEPASPPPTPTAPPVTDAYDDQKKSGGMLWAVAAVVLIIAVAGFFWWQSQDAAPTFQEAPTAVDTTEPGAESVPVTPEDAEPEAADEAEVTDTTEADPVEPAPVAEETPTEPVPETRPVSTGKTFADNLSSGGQGPTMVSIPAGSFEMGSTRSADERPVHKVSLKGFAISQHEITIAEYERFARATGRKVPNTGNLGKDNHPVFNVSWEDAYYYADWLSQQTGKNYRLATEAEWEYAAGTGANTTYWWGFEYQPGSAHCFDCESGFDLTRPTRIGTFKPNPFGLHDMYGNVAEWVQDCWHNNYQGAPTDGREWMGGECNQRVVRGGSFSSPATSLRTSKRDKFRASSTYDNIGIRVVRDN